MRLPGNIGLALLGASLGYGTAAGLDVPDRKRAPRGRASGARHRLVGLAARRPARHRDGHAAPRSAGEIEGALNPAEGVDLATLLAAYTRNGAWVMHRETLTGSIEVGKAADLVVLERNLFELPAEEIGEVRVLQTFFEGEQVYAADR